MLVIRFNDAAVIADLMLGRMVGILQKRPTTPPERRARGHESNDGFCRHLMSTIFNKQVNISPPSITIMVCPGEGRKIPDEELIKYLSASLSENS